MKAATRVRIAIMLLAFLLIAFADYCWIAAGSSGGAAEYYFLGDAIFKLGWPLTQVIFTFPEWAGRQLVVADHFWAIPLADILFIVQWLVGRELIIWFIRLWKRLQQRRASVSQRALI
jgi:hypothetical protein